MEKISLRTLVLLLIVVSIVSIIGTAYTVVSLGLFKYPSQASPSSTQGVVTVYVRSPAQITVGEGKVSVDVVSPNESTAVKSPSP